MSANADNAASAKLRCKFNQKISNNRYATLIFLNDLNLMSKISSGAIKI